MTLKMALLTTALLLPILSSADNIKSNFTQLESMDIKTLIEKAKIASSQERTKIEDLIKKKISRAHREHYVNG